jgi:DNA polymerase-3 subunit alpha
MVKDKRFAFPNDHFISRRQRRCQRISRSSEAIDNTNEIVDKVSILNLKNMILYFQLFQFLIKLKTHKKAEKA